MSPASDLTVGTIGRHIARTRPHAVALDDGCRRLSYGELDQQANRLAAALAAKGLARGAVTCAYLPNCIDYVVVVLAVARTGGVFCPLNPRFKAFELAKLVAVARPRALFTTTALLPIVGDAFGRAPGVRAEIIVVDGDAGHTPNAKPLAPLLAHPPEPLPAVAESDPFSLMFTSGTTGEPKGVLGTHRARMLWVLNAAIEYGLSDRDRYLGIMPQVHSAGLTFTLIHLYVGAAVRILERFNPDAFLEIVERERVTSTLTVPAILSMIVEAIDRSPRRAVLGSLKRVLTCGAPLPLPTKQRVLESLSEQLYDYYGSTESNSMSVLRPRDQMRKPRSVGQPFTNVEIMIAQSGGHVAAPGEVGEIWAANPSVMCGYLNPPPGEREPFSGKWFRTGDLGYLDGENFLHIVGRLKDVIISGGANIYPAEVEQALLYHPAILDCAVVGVDEPRWGQSVKAFVVLREGAALDLATLQVHCAQYLADYKKPRQLECVRKIPKNAGGKAMKSVLLGSHRNGTKSDDLPAHQD